MQMPDRSSLALLWHARAKLTRYEIFLAFDTALRPVAASSQADICVPGMVGRNYLRGGIAIVSVNPAGGTDTFVPTAGDAILYRACKRVGDTTDVEDFETMINAYIDGMPYWGPQWRIISSILQATGRTLPQIAYPYLVPFRTRGDAGSKLPQAVLDNGYRMGFATALHALNPAFLIAVDRPSESACGRAVAEHQLDCQVIYLTRKRDAHDERTRTLKRLSDLTRS